MVRVIKGSAIIDDDGGYLFTPYEKGKPENVNWLTLKKVENGKLDCSKNKVRIVLTTERGDPRHCEALHSIVRSASFLVHWLMTSALRRCMRKRLT